MKGAKETKDEIMWYKEHKDEEKSHIFLMKPVTEMLWKFKWNLADYLKQPLQILENVPDG